MIGTKGSQYSSRAFIVSPKGHVGAMGVPKGVGGRGGTPHPSLPKKKIKKWWGPLGLVHPP